ADLGAFAPHDDAMPFGALLALPVLVVPALARGEPQLAHALPARGVTHVRICPEVSDQDHFVDSASHDFLAVRDDSISLIGSRHALPRGYDSGDGGRRLDDRLQLVEMYRQLQVAVVVPAYNERRAIEDAISTIPD